MAQSNKSARLPEQRNVVIAKPKGVMIPGKARLGTFPLDAKAPPIELSNAEATFIMTKMLDVFFDEKCEGKVLDIYIAACKEKKLDASTAKAFSKPILEVVGATLKTITKFIEIGVPTRKSGDEHLEALRKVFQTLPEPIDHKNLFLMISNKICKYAQEEKRKIREEKEKQRNLKRQQTKEEKEESDRKKVAVMLKPRGEHVGKAPIRATVNSTIKATVNSMK